MKQQPTRIRKIKVTQEHLDFNEYIAPLCDMLDDHKEDLKIQRGEFPLLFSGTKFRIIREVKDID